MPSLAFFKNRNYGNNQIGLGISNVDIESDFFDKAQLKVFSRKYVNKYFRKSSKQAEHDAKENSEIDYSVRGPIPL